MYKGPFKRSHLLLCAFLIIGSIFYYNIPVFFNLKNNQRPEEVMKYTYIGKSQPKNNLPKKTFQKNSQKDLPEDLEKGNPVSDAISNENNDFDNSKKSVGSSQLCTKPQETEELVYTRVLKAGSTTTNWLISELSKKRDFNVQYEMTWTPIWNCSEDWLRHKTRSAVFWNQPWIYVRHVHFIDFQRYGNWDHMPGYFSLIRDPVERIISWYYYRIKQYDSRNVTIDDCVENTEGECVKVHSQTENNFALIPFFCGHDPICLYPNTESLSIAKRNIMQYYNTIGISEDYTSFLQVLEYLYPRYFKGVLDFYRNLQKSTKNKGVRRKEVKQTTKDKIKSTLGLEYELYNFVKQRFYDQLSIIKVKLKSQN